MIFFQVEAQMLQIPEVSSVETIALARAVKDSFREYTRINKGISKDFVNNVNAISDPSRLADTMAAHFAFKIEDKQKLLETMDINERLSLLARLIEIEIEVFRMDQRIKGRVREQMEKTQKNYYLNEQMRAIKKEMGAEEDPADELNELEKRIKRKRMTKEAKNKVWQEFKKLRS